MALTFVQIRITNPAKLRRQTKLRVMVDSGAIYSVVPREILIKLGIRPHSKKQFTLANGEVITREIGDGIFEYRSERGASPVIFGERGDSPLLGAVTLEALGLMLDPLRREIKPIPMVLGSVRRDRENIFEPVQQARRRKGMVHRFEKHSMSGSEKGVR